MNKYEIINSLEERNAEIDKQIDRLIQEKIDNKEKIQELSGYRKEWRMKKKYLVVYQTENGVLGNIEMELRQKTYRSDSYSYSIEEIRQKKAK